MAIPFWGLEAVGFFIDNQRGASIASSFNGNHGDGLISGLLTANTLNITSTHLNNWPYISGTGIGNGNGQVITFLPNTPCYVAKGGSFLSQNQGSSIADGFGRISFVLLNPYYSNSIPAFHSSASLCATGKTADYGIRGARTAE